MSVTSFLITLGFLLVRGAFGQTPFSFFSYIGGQFLYDNTPNEASGLAIAPDRSHLVVASDDGKIFFLNLNDYSSGHDVVDLSDDALIDGRSDFEGIAIDTGAWDPSNMHAYVVHEGGNDDEPYLFKVEYGFDEGGQFSATVVDGRSLVGAIPCLETSNGIESFGLKTPSSDTDPAVFFVGVQDDGKIYEITSEGLSNGPDACYHAGMGVDDVSASTYDGKYIWSFIDREDMIAVVDPTRDCTLAIYDATLPSNEEGLAIDFENGLMYVASDEHGYGPSVISVYNFTYPDDLGECLNEGTSSCSGFAVCDSAPAETTPFPSYLPTTSPTYNDDDDAAPTLFPTYFTINFSGYDPGDDDDDDSSSSSSSSSDTDDNDYDYDDGFSSFFFGDEEEYDDDNDE